MTPTQFKSKPGRLKALRLLRKLSLEDVAERCNCYRSAVSRWESGRTEPVCSLRAAYAKALRIRVGKLGQLVYEDAMESERARK